MLIYCLMILRGSLSVSLNFTYIITSEIFPVEIKARCFGFCQLIGKSATIIMPIVIYPLINLNLSFTFLFYLIVLFI